MLWIHVSNFTSVKVFCGLENLQGLTTYKTWQNRREFCYLTPLHPVSKLCVHSSMTILSRIAEGSMGSCLTMQYTLDCHATINPQLCLELCQERQGAWGRLRDCDSDRERQSEKRVQESQQKLLEALKRQKQKFRQNNKSGRHWQNSKA